MRCPKCGNEVLKEDYVCVFCSARLRWEKIESIPIFRRVTDEKWTSPEPWHRRIMLIITNPSRAFWDIVHYREKLGVFKLYLMTAALFGLMGLAASSHLIIRSVYGSTDPLVIMGAGFWFGLFVFLHFFVFGFIYYFIFYKISILLFSLGANYSIDLSKQLKLRYGGKKEEEEEEEEEEEKTAAMREAEGEYKGPLPEYLTATKSKKGQIMQLAMLPVIIGLGISALIVWIGLPIITVDVTAGTPDSTTIAAIMRSPVWGIIDWIQMLIFIGWVPILMAIALREMANASTLRVYISSVVIAVIIAAVMYFSRPTIMFTYLTP